uniref:Uncharacterized protein n=1 Tax=Arundo donax TaxID=35708 RepID=A0A0A8Y087_ARUDO
MLQKSIIIHKINHMKNLNI